MSTSGLSRLGKAVEITRRATLRLTVDPPEGAEAVETAARPPNREQRATNQEPDDEREPAVPRLRRWRRRR